MSFSLKKHEILTSKKDIKELFENGSSFFLYPYKVFYKPEVKSESHKILVSVAKRNFKRAVDRNLLRRRVREAYRLNKSILKINPNESLSISLAVVYISKFKLPYIEIESKLKQVLVRLNKIE